MNIVMSFTIIIFNQGKLQKDMKSVWQWTLLWPVIIDKTIMQQNRVIVIINIIILLLLLLLTVLPIMNCELRSETTDKNSAA